MTKKREAVLRDVETTQEALKQNIEESARLIERSQALIDRYRNTKAESDSDDPDEE